MLVYIPGTPHPLPFAAPSSLCCNCGQESELRQVDVNLKYTRYFLLAGTELTFTMPLPFCARCVRTANRFRPGWFSRMLVAFGLFWVWLGGLMFIDPGLVPRLVRDNLAWTSAVLACATATAYYAFTRRRVASRTSNYQPVSLRHLKQAFRGEIKSLTLAFSNSEYAARFRDANTPFCESGALVIVEA